MMSDSPSDIRFQSRRRPAPAQWQAPVERGLQRGLIESFWSFHSIHIHLLSCRGLRRLVEFPRSRRLALARLDSFRRLHFFDVMFRLQRGGLRLIMFAQTDG